MGVLYLQRRAGSHDLNDVCRLRQTFTTSFGGIYCGMMILVANKSVRIQYDNAKIEHPSSPPLSFSILLILLRFVWLLSDEVAIGVAFRRAGSGFGRRGLNVAADADGGKRLCGSALGRAYFSASTGSLDRS